MMADVSDPPHVLLLKGPKEGLEKDPYVQILEDNGYTAHCIPVLEFEYINLEELNLCLCDRGTYSCMVLTSQRAVEGLVKASTNSSSLDGWKSKPVFVVGKATGQAVRNLGIEPLGEDTGNAEELVKFILEHIPNTSKPVLFPCGNLAKETIPTQLAKADLELKAIAVYKTSENKMLKENMDDKVIPEFIVFFSPSGVEFTSSHLKRMEISSENTKFVAIGPSTRQALVNHGYKVYSMSDKPSPQSLLEALKLETHSS